MDAREKAHEQFLVLRCQAGDEEAFTRLFERYNPPLKYYLRRLLESPEAADDVLQTVWLKALRGVKRLRRLDAFRAWLYRIARNEAFKQCRQDRRWAEVQEIAVDVNPGNEEEAFTEDDAARVHAGLSELSPPHREVLTLRFLEDLTYDEIASVVGCELGTIRSRIHYAKRALRRILEESNDDG
ncbi:MAG TPA: sigma-70 family RNA polymerase sigma factor [Candidatus Hydrogenedentes bacterium]|nr:sigma-70 family RNA polymerase sigma factor [Candidatus Hydrogenedentota bacterium]